METLDKLYSELKAEHKASGESEKYWLLLKKMKGLLEDQIGKVFKAHEY